MNNININDLQTYSKELLEKISTNGISAIIDLFSSDKPFLEKNKYNPTQEYIKRIIISQFDIIQMLNPNKNPTKQVPTDSKSLIPQSQEIIQNIESSSILQFDNQTTNLLFRNSLNISSEQDYQNWDNIAFDQYQFDKIFSEELYKYSYETENNPIKKFFKSFKYRKMHNQNYLENQHTTSLRTMIRDALTSEPNYPYKAKLIVNENIIEGLLEYKNLKELEDITKMALFPFTR